MYGLIYLGSKLMKFDKQFVWIRVLAVIGLALSVKLAMIYYSANYDEYALSSFCSINDFVDCDGVARTNSSQFLGIPLAYWGIFFYMTVLFLTFAEKLKNIKFLGFLEVFKEPKAYVTFLGTLAFLFSMGLAGISIFKIHKICILCVVTYFIDFIIALIASNGMFKNIVKAFKTTFFDFIDGAKKYTKTFIVLLILATSLLAYSGITLNFVPHIKHRKSLLKYRKIKYNPYRVKGNILGEENATVVVEVYSDYVCPLCYINNIMLHQAVSELKNIKIVHYNYPFDTTCNDGINYTMHPNACFMSKVAIASKEQGNYWEMNSLLYENKPQNLENAIELAKTVNFDINKFVKDVNSAKTAQILSNEINEGNKKVIDATPTMIINGEKVVGVKPYCKLKEILIKHGAEKK